MNKKSINQTINILVIGRVNVGKSLFVSKITKSRIISSDMPGTTVDYIERNMDFGGSKLNITDTAGIEDIRHIPDAILKKASCVLIFLDALQGVTNTDLKIIDNIKKIHSNIYLVCNKCDSGQSNDEVYNIKGNFQDIFFISVKNNFGINNMLTKLVKKYRKNTVYSCGDPITVVNHDRNHDSNKHNDQDTQNTVNNNNTQNNNAQNNNAQINNTKYTHCTDSEHNPEHTDQIHSPIQENKISACIIGRTNSGKSTLLNGILKYQRSLVSQSTHTTRDPVHAIYKAHETSFLLIDTAGFSRNKNFLPIGARFIESSLKSIEESDVAMIVVDGTEDNVMHQDMMLLHKAIEQGKVILLLINKIDKIDDFNIKKYQRIFHHYCEPKILGISGLRLLNIKSILYNMKVLCKLSQVRVTSQQLDDFTNQIKHTLRRNKGKSNRIFYIRQVDVKPPTFHLATRHPVDNMYKKFIARKIQSSFFAPGISIKII